MYRLFKISFVTLALLASVSVTNVLARALTDFVGDRDFWTSYEWEKTSFENSIFYNSSVWEKSDNRYENFRGEIDRYTAKDYINDIELQVSILVVQKPPRIIHSLEYISLTQENNDYYDKLIAWCTEKFGKPLNPRVQKIEHKFEQVIESYYAEWFMGGTTVRVQAGPSLNDPSTIETSLSFQNVFVQTFSTPTSNNQPIPYSEHARPAQPVRTIKNRLPVKTESNEVKPLTKYIQPPYIWEGESGSTNVTDDILNVPVDKRSLFEIPIQK